MHEFDEPTDPPPPPVSKLSKTPSWIMLGFIAGALFVWTLPRSRQAPPPPAPVVQEARPPAALTPPRIARVEAVFSQWAEHAVWDHDVTQIALWNPETSAYSDFFEVLRTRDSYYFRSIPRLTHPLMVRGVPDNAPLQFTETYAQREAWLQEVARENQRAFSEGIRGAARRRPEVDMSVPSPAPDVKE